MNRDRACLEPKSGHWWKIVPPDLPNGVVRKKHLKSLKVVCDSRQV